MIITQRNTPGRDHLLEKLLRELGMFEKNIFEDKVFHRPV